MEIQFVVLDEKTLGDCIVRLSQLTAGVFREWNQDDCSLQDVASAPPDTPLYGCADVTVHGMFSCPWEYPFSVVASMRCLIHVSFDGSFLATFFSLGDVFHFSQDRVVIDRKLSKMPGSEDVRQLSVIELVRCKEDMTPDDHMFVENLRENGRREVEYYEKERRRYRESVLRDDSGVRGWSLSGLAEYPD